MINVENLIQGTGVLYVANYGATEPADSDIDQAPDSNVWTDVGATLGGVRMVVTQNYSRQDADQSIDPAGSQLVRRILRLQVQLAEPTLENFKIALNGGTVSSTAAAAGIPGHEVYKPFIDPNNTVYKALIFDGLAPKGYPRRVIVRRAMQVNDIRAAYTKAGQLVYACEFVAHYVDKDTEPFKVIDQTADAL